MRKDVGEMIIANEDKDCISTCVVLGFVKRRKIIFNYFLLSLHVIQWSF